MLALNNITVGVGGFSLKQITFDVGEKDYFVILGPSGVGKSLLLETIAGLRQPLSGTIHLRGKDVTTEKIQKRNISIVYQDADLFPHLSVYENIAYPLKSRKQADVREKVLKAAGLTGIGDKLNRRPDTLSGGEYQRVSLARSIVADPDIVLLDEPLASIDTRARSELLTLLRTINRQGMTILHVTHDYEEAISVAKRIGVMEDGRLVHVDTPEEIFKHPKSEFIAHFVGVKNFLRGSVRTNPGSDLKVFTTGSISVDTLTDIEDGAAFLSVRPEEITVSIAPQSSSSRNQFKGTIKDISHARFGLEIKVDVGVEIVATITSESRKSLDLDIGKEVWVSFKASSCKLYRLEKNGK